MEIETLACPFCGWHHSIKQSRKRTGRSALNIDVPVGFSFSNIDPSKVLVYQRRKMSGAGRGSKNAKIEIIAGQYLWQLPEPLKEELKSQALKIIDFLENQSIE